MTIFILDTAGHTQVRDMCRLDNLTIGIDLARVETLLAHLPLLSTYPYLSSMTALPPCIPYSGITESIFTDVPPLHGTLASCDTPMDLLSKVTGTMSKSGYLTKNLYVIWNYSCYFILTGCTYLYSLYQIPSSLWYQEASKLEGIDAKSDAISTIIAFLVVRLVCLMHLYYNNIY